MYQNLLIILLCLINAGFCVEVKLPEAKDCVFYYIVFSYP